MNNIKSIAILLFLALVFSACDENTKSFDASGSFEADEIIVSAEQMGKIVALDLEEGQTLKSNSVVGQIDVTALHLQRAQAMASIDAISEKLNNAAPQVLILASQISTQKAQIQTINQQLEVLNKEVERTQNLVKLDAATQQQLDGLLGQQSVLQKQVMAAEEQIKVSDAQISSAKASVSIQNRAILSELNPAKKRLDILDEQISRGQITNLFTGTVLTKYAMAGEFTSMGKPLYKIADLSVITLRAYISGNQLPQIKLNQKVTVLTDDGNDGFQETEGVITWIADKAEFTPKTIQTKNERANLVYAIKVKVKNDGTYKIGMYGELKFQ